MTIPVYMREPLKAYVNDHRQPGNFLTEIICNNLKEAVMYADDVNIQNIPAYVNYFYNHAPHDCWGSKEKMKAWVTKKEA